MSLDLSLLPLSLLHALSLSLFYVAGHERFFNEKISSSIFVAAVVVVVVVVDATFDVFRCEKKVVAEKNRVSKREEEEIEQKSKKQNKHPPKKKKLLHVPFKLIICPARNESRDGGLFFLRPEKEGNRVD